jgi:type VII secretion protein EccE
MPAPPVPAAPAPEPGRHWRVGIGRLVVVQLAVVALLLAIGTRWPPLIAAVAVVVLLALVPLLLRVRGRWYTDLLAARRRLRRRRQHGEVFAPGFEVTGYDTEGVAVGVGADAHGWFVAAEVTGPATVPLDRLSGLLVDGSVPVSAVQVVTWAVPAPHHLIPRQAACAESYRQLSMDLLASEPAASTGRAWVALRLDDRDAVEHTDGTDATARRVLAVALRRAGRSLTAARAGHHVLDPGGLTAAVAACVGLDRGAGPPAEEWASWAAGGLVHVAFEVVRWPATASAETLRELSQVPAAQVVTSMELRRAARAAFGVRTVVRLGAVSARLAEATAQLTARAERAGLRLHRLDGEQAPAGYFCAPTGGSRW